MNCKGLIFFLIFLFPYFLSGQKAKDSVYLKGKAVNFSNQIMLEDFSDMRSFTVQNPDNIFIPDSTGNFQLTFGLTKPGYFKIGRNFFYLSPGDRLDMLIDYEFPEKASFGSQTKRTKEANEYLRGKPFANGGSFLNAGLGIKTTIEETINSIIAVARERKQLLSNYRNITAVFRKLEKARIKADVLNSLISIPGYFPYIHKIPKEAIPEFKENFTKIASPYIHRYKKKFKNQDYLQLDVFRTVILRLKADTAMSVKLSMQIKNWMEAEMLALDMKRENSKIILQSYIPSIEKLKAVKYRESLLEKVALLTKFNVGDVARDFKLWYNNDSLSTLTHFKGKIIYIDLWATWCGPCLLEMPYLETLKIKYKDNPNIVFLSLSIDDNQELWKKFLAKRLNNEMQFITTRGDLKEYYVTSLPRVIIINKDFTIASMEGPMPSSEKAIKLLDSLL